MKLYRIMAAAAVSAALFMGPASVNADAQLFSKGEKNKQTKKELVRENKQMRAMLDSLMRELEALRDTAYEVDDYVEAEKSISLLDGVAPETYSQEVTDSLLNIWYLHRQARNSVEGDYNMDSVSFTSNVPDKVFLERLAKMNSFITLP